MSNELLERVDLDRLDEDHREELQKLARFLSEQAYSTTDMRILYEVTGYQAEEIADWDDYDGKLNLLLGHPGQA